MNQFEQYVSDLRKEGKKQIVIRASQQMAWASGFATWLLTKFETRKLNELGDFVTYI